MRKPVILVTGASGEIGHGLIEHFAADAHRDIVAVDLKPLEEPLASRCLANIAGSILDQELLQRLVTEYEIHEIYHLAALLSTRAEYAPVQAHHVNVDGTLKSRLERARLGRDAERRCGRGLRRGRSVRSGWGLCSGRLGGRRAVARVAAACAQRGEREQRRRAGARSFSRESVSRRAGSSPTGHAGNRCLGQGAS